MAENLIPISAARPAALSLALLSMVASGCTKKSTPSGGSAGKQKAAAAQLSKQHETVQQLLSMVPADAEVVGLILDWKKTYGLLGSLQTSLEHHPFGKTVLNHIRKQRLEAPLPLPWTEKELADIGLDPSGPMAIFGRKKPVMVFSVKDGAKLKKSLAVLWAKGQGKWQPLKEGNLELQVLGGPRPVYCLFVDRRMICSPDRPSLLAAHRSKPQRSYWSTLTEAEQKELAGATLVFSAVGKQLSGLGSLRMLGDGATLRLKLSGAGLRQFTGIVGTKGKAVLPGLMGKARTVVYTRTSPNLLLGVLGRLLPNPQQMGLDPIKVHASLTGELLILEQNTKEMAVVIACRQPEVSRSIVDALIRNLKSVKPSPKQTLPPLKITVETINKGKIYRLQPPAKSKDLPEGTALGLAAAPSGIVFGAWDTVKAIQAQAVPTDSWKKQLSAEELEAFNEKAIIAIRSPLGDPLATMTDMVDLLLRAGTFPAEVKEGIQLLRFFLDQMHSHTLGLVKDGDDQLRLVLRLKTLHRDGQPDDDKARPVLLKGLEAKYAGQSKAYDAALEKLSREFAKTRYGKIQERNTPGLLGRLFTSALAAVVVPAVLQRLQTFQRVEAYENLSKISMGARLHYMAGQQAKGGPLKRAFPPTSAWTPAVPCCKSGGVCQPKPKTWASPTWTALNFALVKPHRFQYRFVNKGKAFEALARTDPTCKGNHTQLRMEGKVGKDGTVLLSPLKAK